MNKINISELRRNYSKAGLPDDRLPDDPNELFNQWLAEAIESEVMEPNAIALATVRPDGRPNVRNVLLKGFENSAFDFFTNYNSEKGLEIEKNRNVSAAIWWPELERQVRMNGMAEKLSDEENREYFRSRPRLSQVGAWASAQSKAIGSRGELEQQFRKAEEQFEGKEIDIPPHWGGYRVQLSDIEFWQGRPGRLHDRILYTLHNGTWSRQRLQP